MEIDDLPNLVLEIIFSYLNQYDDLENVRLVSRRWHSAACTITNILKKSFFRCNQLIWLVEVWVSAVGCCGVNKVVRKKPHLSPIIAFIFSLCLTTILF